MPKFRFRAATPDGTVISGIESSIAIGDLRCAAARPGPAADLDHGEKERSPVRDHPAEGQEARSDAPVPAAGGVPPVRRVRARGPGGLVRRDDQQAAADGPRRHADGARERGPLLRRRRPAPRAVPCVRGGDPQVGRADRQSRRGARSAGRLSGAGDRDQSSGPVGDGLSARGDGPGGHRHDRPGRLRAAQVPRLLLVAQRQAAPADPHIAGHGQVYLPLGSDHRGRAGDAGGGRLPPGAHRYR